MNIKILTIIENFNILNQFNVKNNTTVFSMLC